MSNILQTCFGHFKSVCKITIQSVLFDGYSLYNLNEITDHKLNEIDITTSKSDFYCD